MPMNSRERSRHPITNLTDYRGGLGQDRGGNGTGSGYVTQREFHHFVVQDAKDKSALFTQMDHLSVATSTLPKIAEEFATLSNKMDAISAKTDVLPQLITNVAVLSAKMDTVNTAASVLPQLRSDVSVLSTKTDTALEAIAHLPKITDDLSALNERTALQSKLLWWFMAIISGGIIIPVLAFVFKLFMS